MAQRHGRRALTCPYGIVLDCVGKREKINPARGFARVTGILCWHRFGWVRHGWQVSGCTERGTARWPIRRSCCRSRSAQCRSACTQPLGSNTARTVTDGRPSGSSCPPSQTRRRQEPLSAGYLSHIRAKRGVGHDAGTKLPRDSRFRACPQFWQAFDWLPGRRCLEWPSRPLSQTAPVLIVSLQKTRLATAPRLRQAHSPRRRLRVWIAAARGMAGETGNRRGVVVSSSPFWPAVQHGMGSRPLHGEADRQSEPVAGAAGSPPHRQPARNRCPDRIQRFGPPPS